MSNFNANGLSERPRIGVLARRTVKMEKKIKDNPKPEAVKTESIYSKEELNELVELEHSMSIFRNRLSSANIRFLLEKWLSIMLKPIIANNIIFASYPYHRISVEDAKMRNNYISLTISIDLYSSLEYYNSGRISTEITVGIYELFGNCSSVVINKLYGEIIKDPRSSYSYTRQTVSTESLGARQVFVNDYMKILEQICDKIGGYSVAMYTASLQETNLFVNKYLSENWKKLKGFKNKRNNNEIIYYIKDL